MVAVELHQANKEGTGIKKHERGGSMACPVLFRRYLILLKSPGRVWEAHKLSSELSIDSKMKSEAQDWKQPRQAVYIHNRTGVANEYDVHDVVRRSNRIPL